MLSVKIKKVSYDEFLKQEIVPVSVKRSISFFQFKSRAGMDGMSFYEKLNYLYQLIYEKPFSKTTIHEVINFSAKREDSDLLSDRDFAIKETGKRRASYLESTIDVVSDVLTKISKIDKVRHGFKFIVEKTFDYELKRKTGFKNSAVLEAELHNLVEKLKTLSDEDFYDHFLNSGICKSTSFNKDIVYNIPENMEFIKTRTVISMEGKKFTLECEGFNLKNEDTNGHSAPFNSNTVFPILILRDENGVKVQNVNVIICDDEYVILNTEKIKSQYSSKEYVIPVFFEDAESRNEYLTKEIERLNKMKS